MVNQPPPADDPQYDEPIEDDDFEEEVELAELLLQDDDVFVVAKAAGALSHPAGEDAGPSLLDLLPEGTRPVHRLDRQTSGVLICARSDRAARALSDALAAGKVEKRYLALVPGVPHKKGVIRRELRVDGRVVPAVTRYRRIEVFPVGRRRCSLVIARPETGRLHQIRRHMAGIGHPIFGDRRYADPDLNQAALELFGLRRLFLHAANIIFPHPTDGQKRSVSAGLPEELVDVLLRLGASDKLMQRWDREPSAPPMLPLDL